MGSKGKYVLVIFFSSLIMASGIVSSSGVGNRSGVSLAGVVPSLENRLSRTIEDKMLMGLTAAGIAAPNKIPGNAPVVPTARKVSLNGGMMSLQPLTERLLKADKTTMLPAWFAREGFEAASIAAPNVRTEVPAVSQVRKVAIEERMPSLSALADKVLRDGRDTPLSGSALNRLVPEEFNIQVGEKLPSKTIAMDVNGGRETKGVIVCTDMRLCKRTSLLIWHGDDVGAYTYMTDPDGVLKGAYYKVKQNGGWPLNKNKPETIEDFEREKRFWLEWLRQHPLNNGTQPANAH